MPTRLEAISDATRAHFLRAKSETVPTIKPIKRISESKREKYIRAIEIDRAKGFLEETGIYEHAKKFALEDTTYRYKMQVWPINEDKELKHAYSVSFNVSWFLEREACFLDTAPDVFHGAIIRMTNNGTIEFNGVSTYSYCREYWKDAKVLLEMAFEEACSSPKIISGRANRQSKRINPKYQGK